VTPAGRSRSPSPALTAGLCVRDLVYVPFRAAWLLVFQASRYGVRVFGCGLCVVVFYLRRRSRRIRAERRVVSERRTELSEAVTNEEGG